MGIEYDLSWDADAGEIVFATVSADKPPTRFGPEGTDRWRGRSGTDAGEVLQVRRDESGAVAALDIATFVYARDPDSGPH
jgi:hypothetical protein